jgi:glucose/arabinose dehydrogenase
MAPFGATMSEQDIRAMVIYIRELRERAARAPLSRTGPPPLPTGVVTSRQHGFRIETVVDGLENPWEAVVLPDGRCRAPSAHGAAAHLPQRRRWPRRSPACRPSGCARTGG